MIGTRNVVFDTQIYLRAFGNPSSICGRLLNDWSSYYILHWTDAIEVEILGVLRRPKIRAKFPSISDKTEIRLKAVLAKGVHVEVQPSDIEPICRDPKDDIFLACAKVAKADYLVSEDKDLLVIGQHHTTRIITVPTFLNALQQQ
ncbi:MAG: putative toxin-antitoxin system toxin component, PIN family [Chloroflexi bacterium]|nr:putative toxin-antitoxin system toxin component, PIN family [Chloroflexota bacterium]MCC6894436.1 putative toxin-antitoxin system toxin component, PIN family [Anaerolineae bacterium]